MCRVVKSSLSEIVGERQQYLKHLPVVQLTFLEWMVRAGTVYRMIEQETQKTGGYIILNSEQILVEFVVFPDYQFRCVALFQRALMELKITRIFCKSYDEMLLNCCQTLGLRSKVFGNIYHESRSQVIPLPEKLAVRLAEKKIMKYWLCIRTKSWLIHWMNFNT